MANLLIALIMTSISLCEKIFERFTNSCLKCKDNKERLFESGEKEEKANEDPKLYKIDPVKGTNV